jgi:hypothetical protein
MQNQQLSCVNADCDPTLHVPAAERFREEVEPEWSNASQRPMQE